MLDKFPGFLGYGEIIAIHANWPIYPTGIGWKMALKTIGNFPKETIFYEIDDIDRCKLLINQEPNKLSNPYDSNHYHIALWHDDLIELKDKGFIDGVIDKSEYEFEMIRFENFKREFGDRLKLDEDGNIILYIKDDNGKLRETKYHKPEFDEDEEDFVFKNCAVIPNGVSLTESGIKELYNISKEINLIEELNALTKPFIEIKRFDTAVRDASLLVETKIKEFHKQPNLFGQKLVELHIFEVIRNNENYNSAAIKCYRGELRTIFKFIRNDFAHNFRVLSEEQCKLILSRISDTLSEFNEVINAYFEKK
ncbi:hypothetical protein [Yeosuana sp.]|uniref:hypothetical protein n=1 Tax=Yeosuana sp. TaxID=2529388 RepID=UPI00404A1560